MESAQQEKTCHNCDKVTVCAAFRQAASFQKAFEAEYGDLMKLPFPAELLALNCKEYQIPRIFTKWQQFSYEELELLTRGDVAESIQKQVNAELFNRDRSEKKSEVALQ